MCIVVFAFDYKACKDKKCSNMQFKCNSGKCISHLWICDGINDCPGGDAEDESNCGK